MLPPTFVSFFPGRRKDTLKPESFLTKDPAILAIILVVLADMAILWFFHQQELPSTMGLSLAGAIVNGFAIWVLYRLFRKEVPPTLNGAPLEQKLKDTLIQLEAHEQLAAIGALSAGIAHEIKNPLNFINNFSDMSVELIKELEEALIEPLKNAENSLKENIDGILEDLTDNCKKVHHHGKRAESIIQNMLIQARTSKVEKTMTDINVLLDEYLSLSYHGLRAQNNQFNAKLQKDLDITIGMLEVNPQSMGRVFINIINNALYAAQEKYDKNPDKTKAEIPTIFIKTEKTTDSMVIRIRDNGNGIPESLKQKIFEPFFTTKPVGKGTGLGLSICYDIVVKEHNGKIDIQSAPGEFTEFIITLPRHKV